jgi:hypothetical protein
MFPPPTYRKIASMDQTNNASPERIMSVHRKGRRPVLGQIRPSRRMVRRVFLALGIVGPLLYVAIDILVATRWEDYSYTDQTVSELFAIGAPTRPLAVSLTACCDEVDPCSILESWMLTPKTSERRSSKPSKGAP